MDASEADRLFAYDPVTGRLTWRVGRGGKARAGEAAGYNNVKGYRAVNVNRKMQYAHRIAWLLMTGAWPCDQIDHVNGDPQDNRWANLREASGAQNLANAKRPRSNTSGVKGVSLFKRTGRFAAGIKSDGRRRHLGYFATSKEAGAAYLAAAHELFGEFARES